jgi:membrane-associated phospholipid phosphatase
MERLILDLWSLIFLFLLSLFLLDDKGRWTFLGVFVFGICLNQIFNNFLKGLIRAPRPLEDMRLFRMELATGRKINNGRFGMPSNHAQTLGFMTVFVFLVLKQVNILLFYLAISLWTVYERVVERKHSWLQILVGWILGCLVGFLFYSLGKRWIRGSKMEKKDDLFSLSRFYSMV